MKTRHVRAWIATLALAAAALSAARSGAADNAAPTRNFEMTASRYEFDPGRIEVDEGDRVIVTLRSADTVHGFAIKEFKVSVLVPKDGTAVRAEFVARKPGTYRFACSEYCGSGHSRMKGVLVVKPKGGAS